MSPHPKCRIMWKLNCTVKWKMIWSSSVGLIVLQSDDIQHITAKMALRKFNFRLQIYSINAKRLSVFHASCLCRKVNLSELVVIQNNGEVLNFRLELYFLDKLLCMSENFSTFALRKRRRNVFR